ncbi:MAG: right-handed parallel beta-helix repeat-containing protein [Minicystis sp.]
MLLLASGCGSAGGDCAAQSYPAVPVGAVGLIHVSGACAADGADGSPEHPFATIGAAVATAGKGDAVLIAPGTYAENVTINDDLFLIGSSSGVDAGQAQAVIKAPASLAIVVLGGTKVLIRGLVISQPIGAGINVAKGSVTIEGTRISGASPDDLGKFGYGVVASGGSAIILQHSAVIGSASAGVLVSDSGAIILQNQIDDNAGGGLRLEHATGEVTIQGNTLSGNHLHGIGVLSSRAIILQNTIKDSVAAVDQGGDGILVSALVGQGGASLGPASISADGNTVTGAARVGILCAGEAAGIILQNNTVGSCGAVAPFGAGIWLQGGAGADPTSLIKGNQLDQNRFVGLGLSGDTHGIILQNNTVSGTLLGSTFVGASEVSIGDGLSLSRGASAAIGGNTFTGNGRFGAILDGASAAGTSVENNVFQDNDQYGIILQNQPGMVSLGSNTFMGNTLGDSADVSAGTYAVQDEDFATK